MWSQSNNVVLLRTSCIKYSLLQLGKGGALSVFKVSGKCIHNSIISVGICGYVTKQVSYFCVCGCAIKCKRLCVAHVSGQLLANWKHLYRKL